jgi:hypothetical protein
MGTFVSQPSAAAEPSAPQHGDVVVTREVQSRVCYTVRQLPGIIQFSAAVRDQAVRLARSFGREHGVDVWYGEGGTYRLLGAYRSRTSPQVIMRQAASVSSQS